MFKNYFKTAIRNLVRYKGFSFINILGLTIGISGCLVIGLFVWDELQYDRFGKNYETVYRIYNERTANSITSNAAVVPPMFATHMKQQYPEVDKTLRIMMADGRRLMEVGDKSQYEEKGWLTEETFFDFFPVKLMHGDPKTALSGTNSVVISNDIAQRYFGKENPVGKTLLINKSNMIVKGVMAKWPEHFHLEANYLLPLAAAQLPKERMESWNWSQFYTYIKLKPGSDAAALEKKFQDHITKEIRPRSTSAGIFYTPHLQALENIHLQSADFEYDLAIRGNENYVKGLSIIALFVLVIACFNFINLATARSLRRAKEIGVRKVIGAERRQLIVQFTGETILLSLISVILATLATLLIVPALNDFTGKHISFNPVANPLLGGGILAAGIIVGILAGIYPALVLSGFQPVKVLKGIKIQGAGGRNMAWLRQGLVVVQFALSALLIICSAVVYRQMNYLHNKDLGFNNEQIIYFRINGGVGDNLDAFKEELKRNANVMAVTSGYGLPGDQFAGDGVIIPGKNGEKRLSASLFIGDHDYLKTLGIRVIAGRDFSKAITSDENEAFIINETAVKEFGFETPEKALGQRIHWDKWLPDSANPIKKGRVIGVIKDFHYKSLHEKVAAAVIQIYKGVDFKVAAKLKTAELRNTIAYIDNTWKKFNKDFPLDYKFMDATYGAMYQAEDKLSSLLTIFTILAIFVGCMGLFGLAAFNAEQKTKEISIRKVLGASNMNIVRLLSKTFITPVIIASVIAFPLAWWAMNAWLQDFPYRVEITWWIFGMAGIAAVAIALMTVGFQAIKAAVANPVKSLRSE
jgi:putative ABC transport system permease protein